MQTEVAVIGAGIVGLAFALAEAKRGRQVHVFERDARAVGATIRNFGMIWPIGQAVGPALDRALLSRKLWGEVVEPAGLWSSPQGSLHLAYREDELAVLEAFVDSVGSHYDCRLLSAQEVRERSPATRNEGLLGGLWSATEMIVDPREVPAQLARWLEKEYGVQFHFQQAVQSLETGILQTGTLTCTFDRAGLCCGADLETLFPEVFAPTPITKVKLQMMRTVPQPEQWQMGPALAAGLTLTHYASFAHCPELAPLKARIRTETPWFDKWGIHVMMSQNGKGELVLGDSHEYGTVHDPFVKEEINQHILDYLYEFAQAPDWNLGERWYGVYSKLPGQTEFMAEPVPGVKIVTGLSGAGMTLSFGLAEEQVN